MWSSPRKVHQAGRGSSPRPLQACRGHLTLGKAYLSGACRLSMHVAKTDLQDTGSFPTSQLFVTASPRSDFDSLFPCPVVSRQQGHKLVPAMPRGPIRKDVSRTAPGSDAQDASAEGDGAMLGTCRDRAVMDVCKVRAPDLVQVRTELTQCHACIPHGGTIPMQADCSCTSHKRLPKSLIPLQFLACRPFLVGPCGRGARKQ